MTTVGVDLGGTKILAVLVEEGEVVHTAKKSTPRLGGPEDVLDAVAKVVRSADPDSRASSIGVGVPGPVRQGTGVLAVAANLPGWATEVDVAAGVSARCGDRAVFVDNDVNVATLAESRLGVGRGIDNLLGVFMGTGVGAGLVLDGCLRRGPRGIAGELGHTYVDFRGFVGTAVGRGELEDYAGRRRMEERARARHGAGDATALVELVGDDRMKSSTWEAALEAADPVAMSIIDEATEALAAALASAVALVDIEVVILGGGMAERLGEAFRLDLQARLAARAFAGISASVRAASLGGIAGALGAALIAEEQS